MSWRYEIRGDSVTFPLIIFHTTESEAVDMRY